MNYLEHFKNEQQLNKYVRKRFKQIRESKKLTQNEVSEITDVEYEYYGRVERGRYKPTLFFLITFCSKLDISLQEFFNVDTSDELDSYLKEYLMINKDSLINFRDFLNKYYGNNS